MKIIQIILILSTLFAFSHTTSAQVVVTIHRPHIIMYKSYKDFVDKTGKDYEFHSISGIRKISVMVDGKKESFPVEDFWGWTYKDVLFRVCKSSKTYGAVVKCGNCVYYENGYGWMCALKNSSDFFNYSSGDYIQYISANLDSDMYDIKQDQLEEFKANYPQHSSLADCILSHFKYWSAGNNFQITVNCVDQFLDSTNVMKEPSILGVWH